MLAFAEFVSLTLLCQPSVLYTVLKMNHFLSAAFVTITVRSK